MDLNGRQFAILVMLGGVMFHAGGLRAEPTVSGNATSQWCQDALAFAQATFHSTTSRLYAPLSIPANLPSEMVLGTLGDDLQTTGKLQFNSQHFTEQQKRYWQQATPDGVRLVVKATALGAWGDRYTMLQLPAEVSIAQFQSSAEESADDKKYPAFLQESWRPPLVFLHKNTGAYWFMRVGEPYQQLADWEVYGPAATGYQQQCTISFTDVPEQPHQPLPEPMHQLIGLLDQALGLPEDSGTLQPIVRNRLAAKHFWANAALRPWAISKRDSYNSQLQVAAGLKNWSQLNAENLKIYQQIELVLPEAQQSLTAYYQHRFGLDEPSAAALARWVLEIGYCVNFTFSAGGQYNLIETAEENPWLSSSHR